MVFVMGYSLVVYTVEAGVIPKALGSRDQELFDTVLAKSKQSLKENDEFFEDMEDEEDGSEDVELGGCLGFMVKIFGKKTEALAYEGPKSSGPFPTSEQLLHALIFGEPLDSRCGAKIGYVFEMMVESLGAREEAGSFEGMRSSSGWTGDFDRLLKQSGVSRDAFSIEGKLMERLAPINVPHPEDFPAYGYLLADEAKIVWSTLDTAKLDRLAAEHEYGEDAISAADAVKGWLSKASTNSLDIFGFYY